MTVDPHKPTIYQFPMPERATTTSATEETGARQIEEPGAPAAPKESPRGFLSVARRNLTAEELASPGVQRFMIAEIERLDKLCEENQEIVRKYNDQRVEIAELKGQTKVSGWNEVLFIACLSVGSGGLGAAPAYFGIEHGLWAGLVVLVFSVILIGVAAASKLSRLWR